MARGDTLDGKYRVERVLGSGGMGVVIAAHHLGLDQQVAIKMLLPEALEDPEAATRFEREARAAAKIKSEHIARVTDVSTMEDGSPYMVMEYLEGEDLGARLKRERQLPIREAVDLVLQTCEVLAEAHGLGIIHRDLKPQNLYCIDAGDGIVSIKVLDFGISKITGTQTSQTTLTKTSALMGSPSYMSPEQIQSPRRVDARTDIWAIGVVLYEMIAGRPPFEGDSVPEICLRVTKRSPPSLRALRPDVPPPLEAAIAKCLQKDRTKRYATVGELSLALAPFGTERVQLSVDRIAQVGRSAKGPRPSMFPVPESTGSQQRGVPISWWKTAKWVVARRGLTWSKGTIAAGLLTLAGIGLIGADLLSRRSARLPVSAAPATSRAVATAAPTSSASSGLIPLPIVAPSLPAAEPAVAAAPPADCRVDLNSTPASTVSIDGRKLGTTPKVNVAASPGQHVVVFQHGPRDRVTTSIDCKSGEAKTVSVRIGRETDDSAKATGGKTAPSH